MNEQERNDLQSTITHALQEMKAEAGNLLLQFTLLHQSRTMNLTDLKY